MSAPKVGDVVTPATAPSVQSIDCPHCLGHVTAIVRPLSGDGVAYEAELVERSCTCDVPDDELEWLLGALAHPFGRLPLLIPAQGWPDIRGEFIDHPQWSTEVARVRRRLARLRWCGPVVANSWRSLGKEGKA